MKLRPTPKGGLAAEFALTWKPLLRGTDWGGSGGRILVSHTTEFIDIDLR